MESIEETAVNHPSEEQSSIRHTSPEAQQLPAGFYPRGAKYGMLAGALMAAYLLVVNISVVSTSPALKLSKYLILFVVLGISMHYVKSRLTGHKLFGTGMRMGAAVTVVSAITLVVLNLLSYAIGDEVILQGFGPEMYSWRRLLVLEIGVFFEVLVFGGILTLCWLQYLKRPVK